MANHEKGGALSTKKERASRVDATHPSLTNKRRYQGLERSRPGAQVIKERFLSWIPHRKIVGLAAFRLTRPDFFPGGSWEPIKVL
jgi:hypothetical protein